MPPRITQESRRPRVSDRTMVDKIVQPRRLAYFQDRWRYRNQNTEHLRWKKKMIPPLRGGDFQGMAGLSSDDSLLVGVSTARKRSFNNRPRAVKHRLDEPGQIIPQHGCVPALPASVSPGRQNFSGKATKVVRAAQNQASVITHRGAGSQATILHFRSREKYFS